ncbi:MAG: stage II sporulation protein M [Methanoregula sp.]|jgi:stage II sporulation protein M|nr:stage II sporulation protein M [Methanoregula sp.]
MSETEIPLRRVLPVKNALVVTILLFIVAMLIGWVGTAHTPAIGEQLMEVFQKEVAGQITVGDPADMFVKLLANNLEACIMLFLGGASFGILTLFILGLNGLVIGSVTEIVSQGHSAAFIAAALLPHGIFEIPAFIIAGALGFCMAQSLIAEWYGAGDTAEDAGKYARLFLLYVLPLISVAALVEAFITPAVIHLVA